MTPATPFPSVRAAVGSRAVSIGDPVGRAGPLQGNVLRIVDMEIDALRPRAIASADLIEHRIVAADRLARDYSAVQTLGRSRMSGRADPIEVPRLGAARADAHICSFMERRRDRRTGQAKSCQEEDCSSPWTAPVRPEVDPGCRLAATAPETKSMCRHVDRHWNFPSLQCGLSVTMRSFAAISAGGRPK